MKKIYILVGLPGSGKSTWAKEKARKEKNTIIINKDSFREMFSGHAYIFNKKIERIMHKNAIGMLCSFVYNGYDVILDETSVRKRFRKKLIKEINQRIDCYDYQIQTVYFMPHENNLEWRMKEPRGKNEELWTNVIYKMKKRLDPPLFDDNLTVIYKGNVIYKDIKDD